MNKLKRRSGELIETVQLNNFFETIVIGVPEKKLSAAHDRTSWGYGAGTRTSSRRLPRIRSGCE
ncbi:hypothetical protein FOCC_FOCC010734 [Frankliniella occidentalis]|nr:hypothetical protein FOCC_FOCC010734 [Frankliniella occidentalis]